MVEPRDGLSTCCRSRSLLFARTFDAPAMLEQHSEFFDQRVEPGGLSLILEESRKLSNPFG